MPAQRPERRPAFTRADLPDRFTADTVRELPLATLRRLTDPRNGVLDEDDQRAFDQALREVMRGTAERVSRQLTKADWSAIRRDEAARRARSGRESSRADKQLERIARRIGAQVDLAEALAPGVDWSFAQPKTTPTRAEPAPSAPRDTAGVSEHGDDKHGDDESRDDKQGDDEQDDDEHGDDDQAGTVSDLEQRITDQVELVEVMSEIAEVSRRTFGLEQQRDLQSTRTVFFGLVVSVAVLVAGWAPLVSADWPQRLWVIGLTLATCVLAVVVYALVRLRQNPAETRAPDGDEST